MQASVDGIGRPIAPLYSAQVHRVDAGRGRGFGQAVGLDQVTPVTCFQRSATARCTAMPPPSVRLQRGEVDLVESGRVEQAIEQRVDAGDRGERDSSSSLTKPCMSRGLVIR
jgi:hypothetical protein